MGIYRRDFLDPNHNDPTKQLMQIFTRHRRCTKVTDDMKEVFVEWAFNHCRKVVPSPNRKDVKKVECPISGEKTDQPVYLYHTSQLAIFNEANKPVSEGGCAGIHNPANPLKPLMSFSSFVKLFPPNMKRMMATHMVQMGCENCMDAESIFKAFDAWQDERDQAFKDFLQHECVAGDERYNRVKPVYDEFRKATYVNGVSGEKKYKSMKELCNALTCPRKTDLDLHDYHCCLGHCKECPAFEMIRAYQNTTGIGPATNIIWDQHLTQYDCAYHGPFGSGTTKCPKCEALPEDERAVKKPTSTLARTKRTAAIGDFIKKHLLTFIKETYHQHNFLVHMLGHKICLQHRHDRALDDPRNVFVVQCDYTD